MLVSITARIKDRGSVAWPTVKIPDSGYVEQLQEVVSEAAANTRSALGSLATTRVVVTVKLTPENEVTVL